MTDKEVNGFIKDSCGSITLYIPRQETCYTDLRKKGRKAIRPNLGLFKVETKDFENVYTLGLYVGSCNPDYIKEDVFLNEWDAQLECIRRNKVLLDRLEKTLKGNSLSKGE